MKRIVPQPHEIPSGLCECGCGQPTGLAKTTERKRRHFRGYPLPFLQRHAAHKTGPGSHKWRGGRWTHKSGYVYVYVPDHPNRNRDSYVLEHRLVMEQALGRLLLPTEIVHHINGVKDDNRLENLVLTNRSAHSSHHHPDLYKYSPPDQWRINLDNMTPEQRRAGISRRTKEQRSADGRKGAAARWGKRPPD